MSRIPTIDGMKIPASIAVADRSKVLHALGMIEETGNVQTGLGNLITMHSRYELAAAMDSSPEHRREAQRAADFLGGTIAVLETMVP